jgi:feruloyl-CoA synthase
VGDDAIFAAPDIAVERAGDGSWLLRSRVPLEPYERCVAAVLARWAEATPDAPFLCERPAGAGGDGGAGDGEAGGGAPDDGGGPGDGGGWRRVTYGEAWARARAIGQALLDRGLGPDRPAMVLSGNGIDHGLLLLGCHAAGVPLVPVSVAYSLQSRDFVKLRHIAALTRPGLVFVADRAPFAPALAALDPGPDVEVVDDLAPLAATPPGPEIAAAGAAVGPDTVAKILFTSGSTGVPKGVVTTERMLCANQQMARQVWPFTAREPVVLVDWLPWSHTFGGSHNVGLVLWSGGTLHVDAGRPVPGLLGRTLANLRDVSPTVYFNVPAGFAALLPHLEADAELAGRFFARLRFIMYAAAALPRDLWDRLDTLARRTAGRSVPLTAAWGSTETAPLATTAHFPLDGPGCIGVPVPGVALKLVPDGRKLELRVAGPNVTPGYLGDPDRAAAFDADGYYRMGDAGRFLDPDRPEAGVVFDGRVAEDFKLATGTWVSVGAVRTALVGAGAGAIGDAVLTGENLPELGALVWLTPAGDPDALRAAIEQHNADHPQSSTRIRRALVLTEPPSSDGHEITDKGYINQRAVLDRRAGEVARLHADPPGPDVLVFG